MNAWSQSLLEDGENISGKRIGGERGSSLQEEWAEQRDSPLQERRLASPMESTFPQKVQVSTQHMLGSFRGSQYTLCGNRDV